MIYASRQWFRVLCVIGLSLKLENRWVRTKSSSRTGCVIWLHKHESIRGQRCCRAIPKLLFYIQTSFHVLLLQRHMMLKDRPSPSATLTLSAQREMGSHLQNLSENRSRLCSQMNWKQVTFNRHIADRLGLGSKIKEQTPQDHRMLSPIAAKQLMTTPVSWKQNKRRTVLFPLLPCAL